MKLFIICDSKTGEYYRYNHKCYGIKHRWVDDIQKAKFYHNLGHAKNAITLFSNRKSYKILEFTIDASSYSDIHWFPE